MKYILGLSGYYHDSAACLLKDGDIVAAAQEERFTRRRHDASFPRRSIEFCLQQESIGINDLSAVVFYDKPILTFDRLIETYLSFAPKGLSSFLAAMPAWLKEKIFLKSILRKELQSLLPGKTELKPELLFSQHHQSHAASAFYPSPFSSAAVLCMDGVGEWATTSAWHGKSNTLDPLWEIRFPHSLGLLYSAFTYYTGFKVNSGEYKVMGLAPYGEPKYVKQIYEHLIDVKEDGTFRLNMSYFDYCTGLRMTNEKFDKIFGGQPRKPESQLTQKEMDLARSIQVVTEEIVLKLAHKLCKETGEKNLCLAGGVALNCVSNGRLLKEGPFENIWIQPAAGDAGGALGCALSVWHEYYKQPRIPQASDSMKGSFLGPQYQMSEIKQYLEEQQIPFHIYEKEEALLETIVEQLDSEKVIGWFQGPMEFGPRSLGGRSIIGDARSSKMQSVMNLKIKHRESFRPFAPSIIREKVSDFFELDSDSPYMLLVAPVKTTRQIPMDNQKLWGIDLLNQKRSDIPAVTHVDYSARVQTVTENSNPRYYKLLKKFGEKTGYPILVNTSFNVRGEPIVCSPEDAYRCFMRTEMDVLVLENYVLLKEEQPQVAKDDAWKTEFELD